MAMHEPDELEKLIKILSCLPGFGPRSARRAVLHMVQKRKTVLTPLTEILTRVHESAQECLNCANITTSQICEICTSNKRKNGQICIVESSADLWAMERSHAFHGRYHVLGGTLSALECMGPDELKIPKLVQRVNTEDVSEVILALSATIDGQTTAHYIAELLPSNICVTSLAQGVPIGGELDYLDDGTIFAALNARQQFTT